MSATERTTAQRLWEAWIAALRDGGKRFGNPDWHRQPIWIHRVWERVAAALPPVTIPAGDALMAGEGLDRLRAIEAAAREYAASRRDWEAALPIASESGIGFDEWRALEARQETARANLLALFSGEAPA